MTEKARARIIVSGRVQGVFFRMETKYAAKRYGISGWARNLQDGTVEAEFEGDADSIRSLIDWCRKGPPAADVKSIDVEWKNYKGEFNEFIIVY